MPSSDSYRVSVKRELHGAASEYLHRRLRVGDVIEVGAPRGSFVLRAGDRPVVLISAGVGATPVLAMLHVLASAGSSRPVWWVHSARNRAEHAFKEEARRLLTQLPDAHHLICYSQPGERDEGFDHRGRLTKELFEEAGVPIDADFYLCGPARFMDDITAALIARGAATERISTEVFGAAPPIMPGVVAEPARPPHPPAGVPGSGPLIAFSRSNLSVAWDPTFASLLELAEACDVPVRWSCRTGVCRTCETALISGEVGYQPDPLEPPTPGTVLICCSQPSDEVALDL
jgi:ferredoxin-NADP reductase